MNALRILLLFAAAALVMGVVPYLSLRPRYFHSPAALIAVTLLVPPKLFLCLGIERWTRRLTGYCVPFSRRMLIPMPAFLCVATTVIAVVTPVGGYGTGAKLDFYGNTMLLSMVLLPFLLVEDVRTPVRFILGVWAGYALWLFGFVVVMINLRLPGPP